MSPASHRMFQLGVGVSITLAVATVGAGVWALVGAPFNAIEGPPVGNKQLAAYHFTATEFRVATVTEEEVFLSFDSLNLPALAASYRRWGGKDHWLKVPAVEVNLWWAFACSVALPGITLARRVRRRQSSRSGLV